MRNALLTLLFALLAPLGLEADILDSLREEADEAALSRPPQRAQTQAKEEQIDSLLNVFFKETQVIPTVKDCEPTKNNPQFPDSVYRERLAAIRTAIPMPYNPIVRQYIDKYCNRMRLAFSAMLGASNFYMPAFETALESEQLPGELKYLPIIESGLNPTATSPRGAAGLWQFMPATGRSYGLEINSLIDERRDLEKASYAATTMLRKMYAIYKDWTLVIAAYNCGPGAVNKAIKRAGGGKTFWDIYNYLPRETRGYVPSFIAATYVMTYYCEHGICPVETSLPPNTDTVMISRRLTLAEVARQTGATTEMIRRLNPQYRANVIPGSRLNPCSLRLPEEYIYKYIQRLEGTAARRPQDADATPAPQEATDDVLSPAPLREEAETPKPEENAENKKAKKVPVSD